MTTSVELRAEITAAATMAETLEAGLRARGVAFPARPAVCNVQPSATLDEAFAALEGIQAHKTKLVALVNNFAAQPGTAAKTAAPTGACQPAKAQTLTEKVLAAKSRMAINRD